MKSIEEMREKAVSERTDILVKDTFELDGIVYYTTTVFNRGGRIHYLITNEEMYEEEFFPHTRHTGQQCMMAMRDQNHMHPVSMSFADPEEL